MIHKGSGGASLSWYSLVRACEPGCTFWFVECKYGLLGNDGSVTVVVVVATNSHTVAHVFRHLGPILSQGPP